MSNTDQHKDFLLAFGKHLNRLRIYRNFNSVDSFGTAYNNGKQYKSMSAYLKGKNIKFGTLFRLAKTLNIDIPDLLDVNKEKNFRELSNSSEKYWSGLFCKNTNSIRIQKEVTQLDLEQDLHILRENITNYETGKIKPELSTILSFAAALQVEPFELFVESRV